jgi:hypothetical protein
MAVRLKGFSNQACEFAKGLPIELINRGQLDKILQP